MIVKQRKMKLPKGMLFGLAGGVFGLATIGLILKAELEPETFAPCAERYAQAGMLALERSQGVLLDPITLQSRLGGQEWGVLHNIAIAADDSAEEKVAMTVKFDAGGEANFANRRAPSGVGFKWLFDPMRPASGACLSYAVKLPAGFAFGTGGTLPGLFGAGTARPRSKGDGDAFSMRMRWLGEGRIGVQPVTPKERTGHLISLSDRWLKMPRGQWVTIEQEVLLNTPGKRDGTVRVWIDGQLHLNLGGLALRKDADTGFRGVIADTHYATRNMAWAPAPAATNVKLSPMIVRWN